MNGGASYRCIWLQNQRSLTSKPCEASLFCSIESCCEKSKKFKIKIMFCFYPKQNLRIFLEMQKNAVKSHTIRNFLMNINHFKKSLKKAKEYTQNCIAPQPPIKFFPPQPSDWLYIRHLEICPFYWTEAQVDETQNFIMFLWRFKIYNFSFLFPKEDICLLNLKLFFT